MRKLFILASLFFTVSAFAQSEYRVTEYTVVKDSTGQVLPYSLWNKLLLLGTHKLKPENPKDDYTAYTILRLSGEELEEREKKEDKRVAKMSRPSESGCFKTGQSLNLGDLTDMTGAKLNASDLKGKIVVVNFWFIGCPPCRSEIPELNKLVEKHRNNDKVVFIGIALDPKQNLETFLAGYPFLYRIVANGYRSAASLGVRLYPTNVVLDGEGKVYFQTAGLAQNTVYWIKKSINELLQQGEKTVASNPSTSRQNQP